MVLPESGGYSLPNPPGSYAYVAWSVSRLVGSQLIGWNGSVGFELKTMHVQGLVTQA